MKIKIVLLIIFPILLMSLFQCATPPPVVETPITQLPDSSSDILNLARKAISIGSPATLLTALELLGENTEGDSESGLELQAAAWFLLESVYPLVLPDTTPPIIPSSSVFTMLFQSINEGLFPEVVPDDITFLTSLISPVVVLKSDSELILEQSREILEQLLIMNRESVLPVFLLGVLSEKMEDPLAALEYYTNVVDIDFSVYPAEIGISRIQMRGGQPEQAIKTLERLNTLFPDQPQIIGILGEAYFLNGEYEKSLDRVTDTLLLVPDDTELLFLRARILEKIGRPEQARRILSIVERELPVRFDVLHLKAVLLRQTGNLDSSLSVLERALELYPENDTLTNTYGEVLIAAGQTEAGRAVLSGQISITDEGEINLKSLQILLNDAVESGLWEAAKEYSAMILTGRREKNDLLLAREIELALDNSLEVLALNNELYALFPEDELVEEYYIGSLIEQENFEPAGILLERALADERNSIRRSRLYYLLSLTRSRESEQIDFLRSALLENLENKDALMQLSEIYVQRRDYRNAYRYLKQAYLLDPDDLEIETKMNNIEELLP